MLPIRIPGTFVVLQGIPGDGMRNTMDSLPSLPIVSDDEDDSGLASTSTTRFLPSDSRTTTQNDHSLVNESNGPDSVEPEGPPLTAVLPNTPPRRDQLESVTAATSQSIIPASPSSANSTSVVSVSGSSTMADNEQIEAERAIALENTEGQQRQEAEAINQNDASVVASAAAAVGHQSQAAVQQNVCVNANSNDTPIETASSDTMDLSSAESETIASPVAMVSLTQPLNRLPQVSTSSSSNDSGANERRIQEEAINEWTRDCRDNERFHFQEWNEAAASLGHSDPRRYHILTSSTSTSGTSTTASISAVATTPWWMTEDGCLSVMESLPHSILGTNCGFPGRCIGQLHPGTVVVATELVTLCSVDLVTRIDVTPFLLNDGCGTDMDEDSNDGSNSSAEGNHHSMSFPPGRQGWVQMLKLESPVPNSYCVLSVDGYPFLGPGLPSVYCDCDRWLWRVVCIEGAFVRSGLDLQSEQLATIPYGSFVRVKRKTFNNVALARLQIEAVLYDELTGRPSFISGWISEFFNPLSGQRGSIVQPIPFPVPAVYMVTFGEGAVIRSDVDLSSPEIGHAPQGALVTVTGRVYSERPTHKCIVRYRLAGNGGWISARLNMAPPLDEAVVTSAGIWDAFESDKAGEFHLSAMRSIVTPSIPTPASVVATPERGARTQNIEANAAPTGNRDLSATIPSVLNTELERLAVPAVSPSSTTSEPSSDSSPACVYSVPILPHISRQRQRNDPTDNRCSICLCEDRTATIVHGETGHIVCCLVCARILKARDDPCPVCRLPIDLVVQHFWA